MLQTQHPKTPKSAQNCKERIRGEKLVKNKNLTNMRAKNPVMGAIAFWPAGISPAENPQFETGDARVVFRNWKGLREDVGKLFFQKGCVEFDDENLTFETRSMDYKCFLLLEINFYIRNHEIS
jgi:hypothetical protein